MKIVLISVFSVITSVLEAKLELASLFTDKMVVQRQMDVPVWGWADPNVDVTVSFSGQKMTTRSDKEGKWLVSLPPLRATFEGSEFRVSDSKGGKLLLSDVIVGDVWICSGQSNMQMSVNGVPETRALAKESSNIRSFLVPRTVSFSEEDKCGGQWSDKIPDSAVAFGFAYHLQKTSKVPVGIILTAWGSSSIEAWMPRKLTKSVSHFRTMMEEFDADNDTHQKIKTALEKNLKWSKKEDVFLRRQPNILYNAMLHPLIPYACQGIVWYQGERNTQSMHGMVKEPWFSRNSGMLKYGSTLKKWIQCYRENWQRDDLHLLVVMLPGFGKNLQSHPEKSADHPAAHSWAWMRESQLSALELSGVGVVNTIDLGDIKNVHPKDKLPIGIRLAELASEDSLKNKVVTKGPVYKNAEVLGEKIVVTFDDAAGLKTTDGKAPKGFWVANDLGKWERAEAEIQGSKVIIQSSSIQNPLYVRYAFAGKPNINLINNDGLPAYPFRTDSFQP